MILFLIAVQIIIFGLKVLKPKFNINAEVGSEKSGWM